MAVVESHVEMNAYRVTLWGFVMKMEIVNLIQETSIAVYLYYDWIKFLSSYSRIILVDYKEINFLSLILIANNLKQLGESCGSSRTETCGICVDGLECNAPFDACGECIVADIFPRY